MFIRDQDAFERKWRKFSTDGVDSLLVIADFDYTLTTSFTATGERAPSSHGILMENEKLGLDAVLANKKLFDKFYPISQSSELTKEEKIPYMEEGWTKTHELLIKNGVTKTFMQDAVDKSDIAFRDRLPEVFQLLEQENVPTLIFSAGLYDVIHQVLNKEFAKTPAKSPPKNIHVIANMMRFDESGLVAGFDGTLIHSFNKNATAMLETSFWNKCRVDQRRNILLLGDSLGDADMADGLDFEEHEIVRVGFLNENVSDKLDLYLQHFDVVLTNDSSLAPLELLLQRLRQ